MSSEKVSSTRRAPSLTSSPSDPMDALCAIRGTVPGVGSQISRSGEGTTLTQNSGDSTRGGPSDLQVRGGQREEGGGGCTPPIKNITCAQLNLHRAPKARDHLACHHSLIQFFQEPPVRGDRSVISKPNSVVYAQDGPQGGARAAIRVSKSLVSAALPQYMCRDRAVCTVKHGGGALC